MTVDGNLATCGDLFSHLCGCNRVAVLNVCYVKAFKCEGQLLSTLAFTHLTQTSLSIKTNHKQIIHLEFQDLKLTCMIIIGLLPFQQQTAE